MDTGTVRSLSFAELRVGDVMTIDPVVVRDDDTLETAERLVAAYEVSGLPVVNADRQLVGVISKTDLVPTGSAPLEALLRGKSSSLRVGELMSSPAITVPLTATLVDAARIMHDARIHRVVVVGDDGAPVGVLAASDYVALVAEG